jgi:type I restriction enzyme, S subunit
MRPNSDAWQRLPIVSLCEAHVDCVNRTAPVVNEPTPFRMLRTTNVRNGYVDAENVRYVTEETYKTWTRRLVPKRGDILLTREAPLGDVGKIRTDEAVFLGQRLYHFRPDPKKLDADFLLYSLLGQDLQSQIKGFGSGSTVEHMRLEDIPSLEFNVPRLLIQRLIAGILSAYDDLIENSQRRIKILESMARALYREWFVHFRYPGHESVPLVPSPLGEIPQGWEVKPFSELASYTNGYAFKPGDWGDEGRPIIKIKELKAGVTADTPRNSGDGIPEKYTVRDGDVLFSWSADLDAYLWMGGEGLLNQHLFNVVPFDEFTRSYCFHSLKESMQRFRALSLGATMHHIKRSALDQVSTVVPPTWLRAQFDCFIQPIHQQLITLANVVQNLRRTRDLLLPRLLSGQIDVAALGHA